jgi:hypothetical protein
MSLLVDLFYLLKNEKVFQCIHKNAKETDNVSLISTPFIENDNRHIKSIEREKRREEKRQKQSNILIAIM